ncbi:anti-anti-sigma factor [Nocardioides terrae]|uniref:Anti-sigma factor antagonist n=1 Tax=Nocardioides terrae TaxID=574651 RepID=A0A1I1GQG3_9ACTN|nr:STAS domain-containing protein [Nocardioides terrae]SFC13705.1 anti-anti-sigma factor [Nocardioides terrae]
MVGLATSTGPDGAAVLAVSGDLDIAGVAAFLEHAQPLLQSDAAVIEVDLRDVTFLDSSGIGALVRLRKATADGQRLRLSHVPASVARVLELTGLTDLFADRSDW